MADLVYPGKPVGGTLNTGALPKNYNLEIYQGDYVELIITVKDELGVAVDLTGSTAAAQLKQTFSASTPVEFDCTLTGVTGQVRVYLSSASSTSLSPGDYVWDFQITNPSGDTRTYLAGDVLVHPEVTT